MDVVLPVGWEIVVDDQGNLLDVDTTGQEISSDKNTAGSRPELTHDHVTFLKVKN